MSRTKLGLFVWVSTLILTACSSSVGPVPTSDSGASASAAPVSESAADVILRDQKEKLAGIRREYENCKDLKDYSRLIKLARARRTELDVVIRRIHKMDLSSLERERVLNPLRQERDWHLEVMQAASKM